MYQCGNADVYGACDGVCAWLDIHYTDSSFVEDTIECSEEKGGI